jgi:hypothetical protein
MPDPQGNAQQGLKDTSSRKSALKRTKGQPESFAVTGETRKPGVVETGLVSEDTAGQNNSNLTSLSASAANGEWELIFVNSSHYCFYATYPFFLKLPQSRIAALKRNQNENHLKSECRSMIQS